MEEKKQKMRNASKSKRPEATVVLMSEQFPLLSQQPGLAADIREDLSSTDNQFGSRHKRGKAARRELLENMENRLELALMRGKFAHHEALKGQLQKVLSSTSDDLTTLFAVPMNLAQSEAVFQLSFLHLGKSGPEFTLDTKSMFEAVKSVASDELSIQILRELIVSVNSDTTAQDIATSYGLGRQAIYDRQNRLITKLDAVIADTDFQHLIDYLRTRTCIVKSARLTASMNHPLVAILLLQPDDFPSVHDLMSIAFWGIARQETGERKSFRLVSRNSEQWIECSAPMTP